jgi:RND family efflux transporter MFP subunit
MGFAPTFDLVLGRETPRPSGRTEEPMHPPSTLVSRRRLAWGLGGLALAASIGAVVWFWGPWGRPRPRAEGRGDGRAEAAAAGAGRVVRVDRRQQEALGIATAEVTSGTVSAVLEAPGQVVPDESHFAYITPRVKGVIREVKAQIGQFVRKGDLLASIDSSDVAQARLALIDSLTRLEIARAKHNWQESIYRNGLDLIEMLKGEPEPEEVQRSFADRPVGRTREELLTAYANYHLSRIASGRYESLSRKDAVPVALAQQKQAEYQVDKATYEGLMDRMAFEVTLDYTLARQELREARTAVKVAGETLRVFGVPIDRIAGRFESGELTGGDRRGEPKATLREAAESALRPSRDVSELMTAEGEPVSMYELRAPFDGTILERERIVPGVVVDGTHHLFTMAGLETVWVEAHVHESDFGLLGRGRGGSVEFTSPAYPDEVFRGEVLYTGDMVDPKSRTVRLLATAENPDRKLKPGMFLTVEIHSKDARELPKAPTSALLTDDDAYFVFVQAGPERFERRAVRLGDREGDEVAVLRGLDPGERVVVRGAFELKSKAHALKTEAGGG